MIQCTVCICNSYTMAARDFADIYIQSPRAVGVYICKIPSSLGISDIYITPTHSPDRCKDDLHTGLILL